MSDSKEKAAKCQRSIELFKQKPEEGSLKVAVKASTKDGLVTLKSGKTTWEEDFPPCFGGQATTVGPVQHLLGALGGCAAGLIKNTLGPLAGLSIDSVDVDAQCEFDARGVLGMKGATADLKNLTLTVTIYSDESRGKIEKLFELWKQRCPVYLCFVNPPSVAFNLVDKKPGDKAAR